MQKILLPIFLTALLSVTSYFNANAQCAGTPTAGSISPASAASCNTFGNTLSLVGNDAGVDISFQWQISLDSGTTYINMPSDTADNFDIPASLTPGYYMFRCKVACRITNDSAYSSVSDFTLLNPISIYGYAIANSCPGSCDGILWVDSVKGGDGHYDFDPTYNGNIYSMSLCVGVYPVIVSDNSGCSTTENYTINDPIITYNFTAGSICLGDTATLTVDTTLATGPFTFSWHPSTDLSSTNLHTVEAYPTTTTVYTVDITNGNGCLTTVSDVLTVNPLPVISINSLSGGSITQGASDTLIATGGVTYNWYDNSTFIGSGDTVLVTPTTSTYYTVIGINSTGCGDTASYYVNVILSGPIQVSALTNNVSCAGLADGFIQLSITGGVAPYTFSWSNGAITQNIANLSAGTYFVTVTDAAMNTQVATATVSEPSPITVTANALINEVCSGSNGEINVSVLGGTPNYTLTWSSGQNTDYITNLPAGTYNLTVTDANGCVNASNYSILNTFLHANIHGTAQYNGNFVTSGKAYLYGITDTTAYILSDSANLNIFGEFDFMVNNVANYIVMVKADTALYPNTIATFYGDVYQWNKADTITTSCGSGDTIGINLSSLAYVPNGSGIISGTVLDITDSTDQRRPGEPLRGIDIILENASNGNAVTRMVTDNNGEYLFTGVPTGNYKLFVQVPGCVMANTYHISITGINHFINRDFYVDSLDGYIDTSTVVRMQVCAYTPQYTATTVCLGDTTVFTDISVSVPLAIAGYRWDFDGDGVADDTTKGNVSAIYQTAGTFNTTLTIFTYDGVCTATAHVTVTVNDLPRVVVIPDTIICTGNNLMLSASGAVAYSWVNDTSITSVTNDKANINTSYPFTKSFVVYGTDVNGCANTDTADVVIHQTPGTNFLISKNNICLGAGVLLTDTSTNVAAGTTYSWDFNNDGIIEDTTPGSITVNYVNSGGYNIALTLTSPQGCSKKIIKPITVRPNPLIVSAGYDKSIICGASTPLQAYCNTSGVTYQWSPNYYLGNPFIANTTATPDTTVSYIVKVTKDGCTTYDTVLVLVTPLTVDAGLDYQIICSNSITLNGTSNGVQGTAYQWYPGTGLSSQNTLKPNATPTATTTYVVTAVKNTCFASDTVIVTVSPIAISAGSDKAIICGQSASLAATSPGTTGLTWSWSPALGLNNPSTANVTASPTNTTNYVLTGLKGNCVSRDTVKVTVNPFSVSAGPDKSIDCGNSTLLQATSFYTSGTTYLWTPNTGLSSAISLTPTASPTATTNYTLTVTKGNCISSDTVNIKVNQEIPISFSADKTVFSYKYPPYTVKFTNNTPNANNYTFKWNFGDGTAIITAKNYTYSYQRAGNFTVSLYAENLNGTCKDTLTYVDYITAWSPTALPNQLAVNYEVDVYPNPGNGMITIGLNDSKIKEGIISILDVSGQLVRIDNILLNQEGKMNVDLTDFSKGVYFIKLENDDQVVIKRYVKE